MNAHPKAPKASALPRPKENITTLTVSPCQYFKQQADRAVDLAKKTGRKVRIRGEDSSYTFLVFPGTDPRKLHQRIAKKELGKPCECDD